MNAKQEQTAMGEVTAGKERPRVPLDGSEVMLAWGDQEYFHGYLSATNGRPEWRFSPKDPKDGAAKSFENAVATATSPTPVDVYGHRYWVVGVVPGAWVPVYRLCDPAQVTAEQMDEILREIGVALRVRPFKLTWSDGTPVDTVMLLEDGVSRTFLLNGVAIEAYTLGNAPVRMYYARCPATKVTVARPSIAEALRDLAATLPPTPPLPAVVAHDSAFADAVREMLTIAMVRDDTSFDIAIRVIAHAPPGLLTPEQREKLRARAIEMTRIKCGTYPDPDRLQERLTLIAGAGFLPAAEGHPVVDPREALARVTIPPQVTDDAILGNRHVSDGYYANLPPAEVALRGAVASILGVSIRDLWGVASFTPEEAVLRHLSELCQRKSNGRGDGRDVAIVDFLPTMRVVCEVARRAVAQHLALAHGVAITIDPSGLPLPAPAPKPEAAAEQAA